ncbi:hypothetical protein SADUNF_Sadunf01G0089500 [Salix dunnii]|uniref:Uncharacterized protein n=1 Tax=Salix dunnii TaxID=1413687 RepID=A0A835NAK9_9ROSI|nr:hypothetical protein SADUNF_Sadunf01G0089500 [Salix dunnii]
MGSLFSLTLVVLLSLAFVRVETQGIRSARLLDLLIRDYTLRSSGIHFKTGKVHTVDLPANFSGIEVDTVRFRCGSLRRYGAQVKEFHLGIGVTVQPCVERLLVIRQNLDLNWSSIYYANYDLSGYQIVSPILGLLAYNFGSDVNVSNSFEIGIHAGGKPITIDFINVSTTANVSGIRPLCAIFENDGKVKKKARMEEMERRAYEEEALQVSMVGHVRAPTATVTRTSRRKDKEFVLRRKIDQPNSFEFFVSGIDK